MYQIKELGSIPIVIERNQFKNRSRGKTYHPDFKLTPKGEILESINSNPRNETKVSEVIKLTKYDKNTTNPEETGEIKLVFDGEILPKEVVVDYLLLDVTQFIPRPPMCRKCYKLGQHITSDCTFPNQLCGWCGKIKHVQGEEKCDKDPECRNCGGSHPAWSKDCCEKAFLEEVFKTKEIQKTSIGRAKKIVNDRTKSVNRNKEVFGEKKLKELLDKANEGHQQNVAAKEAEHAQELSQQRAALEQKWEVRFNEEIEKMKHYYERKMEQRENTLLTSIAGLTEQIKAQSNNIANLTQMYWDVAAKCGISGIAPLSPSPPEQLLSHMKFSNQTNTYIENIQDYSDLDADNSITSNSDSEREADENSEQVMEEDKVSETTGKRKSEKTNKKHTKKKKKDCRKVLLQI